MNFRLIPAAILAAALGIISPRADAASPTKAYTLLELLELSHVIAIGEVVPPRDTPPAKAIREGHLRLSTVIKGDVNPGLVRFVVDGPPLPTGARAIWILREPNTEGVYTVDHPQCAYDVAHRTLLEVAIRTPEKIRPQHYLRSEDERLARMIAKEQERRALGAIPESNATNGLSLAFRVTSSPARAGGTITVQFVLTNSAKGSLLICDSSEECYYLRAQHAKDGAVHVGKAGADTLDIEKTLDFGSLITAHDFVTLAPGESITRMMSVSAGSVPPLGKPGMIDLAGVYRYKHDAQAGLTLSGEPWVGAVASRTIRVELLPAAAPRGARRSRESIAPSP